MDFDEKYSEDGKTLIAYNGGGEVYEVEEGVEGIGSRAFENSKVRKIYLPESLQWCSSDAFTNAHSLQEIVLSRNFAENREFESILFNQHLRFVIPEGTTKLSRSLFTNCGSVSEVIIPSSICEINQITFAGSGLKICVIPEGVKRIGANAFFNARQLKVVELPKSLEEFYLKSFLACDLRELHVHFESPDVLKTMEGRMDGFDIERCQLFVPIGTKERFQNHEVFGQFKEIIEEKQRSVPYYFGNDIF